MVRSGTSTVMDAVAAFPVPPFEEVTFTENEHEALAAIVPPAREMLCAPAAAVTAPPPHVPVRPFGEATAKPAGSGSVNATPLRASDELGFVIVKFSEVEAANAIEEAPNVLAMLGGEAMVKFAVALLPLPPSVEVTLLVVFVKVPEPLPVTLTVKVQEAPAAMFAPERTTLPEPLAAAMVPPPHEPVSPFAVAMVSPAGSVSLNATPVKAAVFAAGFAIVKLSAEFVPGAMAVGLKDSAIAGGATTTCGFPASELVLPLKVPSPA